MRKVQNVETGDTVKGSIFEEHYSQLENRLTEAFLKVLKYATSEITDSFIRFVGVNGQFGDYVYDFQVGNDVQVDTQNAVLIGIAETKQIVDIRDAVEEDKEDVSIEEREGIPDGFLHARNGSLSILFEMKRGGGKLYRQQLDAHKRRFVGIDDVQEIVLTWRMVREFMLKERLNYEEIHRNTLLLDAFQEFCKEYMIGEDPTEITHDRYLARFQGRTFEVLHALDECALSLMNDQTPHIANALEYKIAPNAKPVFTIWTDRRWIIFKPKAPYGLHVDLLTAKLFGKSLVTPFDDKSQESFLHIDWIQTEEQIEQLKEMIKYSTESKYHNRNLTAREFILRYNISMTDYQNSRLGRPDQSFFHKNGYQARVEQERERILNALATVIQ
jgi:hypothetical protein